MPTINLENCTKCLKCVKDCPSDAIDIEKGTIDEYCIHCGHCVAICPESTVYPDSGEINDLYPSSVTASEFHNLSSSIRSCRSYKNLDVDEETLNLLIENMAHYPSASNTRPVEISIIRTRDAIQKLDHQTFNTLVRIFKFVTTPIIMPIIRIVSPKLDVNRLNNYKKRFIARQAEEASQICHYAPVVMLFHAPRARAGMASADAYIWATYTSIYASTMGLGTCFNGFITNAMRRSKSMRKEFKIPLNHKVHSALLIGHPKVKYFNEAGREKPRSIFI